MLPLLEMRARSRPTGYSVGCLPGFFKGFDSPKSTAGEIQHAGCWEIMGRYRCLRCLMGKYKCGSSVVNTARKTLALFAARPCGLDGRASPLQGCTSLRVWSGAGAAGKSDWYWCSVCWHPGTRNGAVHQAHGTVPSTFRTSSHLT